MKTYKRTSRILIAVLIGICCFAAGISVQAQGNNNKIGVNESSEPVLKKLEKEEDASKAKVYRIPFKSEGNEVQLEVENTRAKIAQNIKIEVKDVPEWIEFEAPAVTIEKLDSQKSSTASFTFHILKEAPVNEKTTIRFVGKSDNGYILNKEIELMVDAPTELKLHQNYPNPFNPTTTITYELPAQMKVSLLIFNVLGQKVATLVDGTQDAGGQTIHWNATRLASGMYFYRIIADAPGENKIIQHKKMMLIK